MTEQPDDRLLTQREVEGIASLKHSALWVAIREGRFPKPRKLGNRCNRWRHSDIQNWIAELPESDGE